MRAILKGMLAATVIAASGCSLTIDTGSVKAPEPQKQAGARGTCIAAASGHQVCGDLVGAGSAAVSAPSGHAVRRSRLQADGASAVGQTASISSSQHAILQGAVSP